MFLVGYNAIVVLHYDMWIIVLHLHDFCGQTLLLPMLLSHLDQIRNTSIKKTTRNYSHLKKMQKHRLCWYGYVLLANLSTVASSAYNMHMGDADHKEDQNKVARYN